MIVIGADVHKRTHTFVAVDEVGRKVDQLTVAATWKGHDKALRWARERFGGERRWGIEDCRHLSARLERDLLTGGEQVVRVPPKLMAQTRASARTRGKSDPIDALAVARAPGGAARARPARDPKPRSLDLAKHRDALAEWLATEHGLVAEIGTPASRRSRSGRATQPAGSATPDPATGSSTPLCIGSRSPRSALRASAASTTANASPPAIPPPRPSEP